MTLDKTLAAEALAEIRQSQERSVSLYAYAHFAPFLFTTGALWMAADLGLRFLPDAGMWAWPAASAVGVPIMLGIAVQQSRRRPRGAGDAALDRHFWRGMGIWLLVAGFVYGTFFIFSPTGPQVHGFMGLLTGAAFATAGMWLGWRVLATGLAMAAVTLACHAFLSPGDAVLAMGIVGGGGMMLGALWLWRA